jgi:hypothetical protein
MPEVEMQNNSWAADNQFGPAVKGTRSNFDFTLLFENTILTIVPSTIFLFAALLRARSLYGSSKKVAPSWTRLQKIVCLLQNRGNPCSLFTNLQI